MKVIFLDIDGVLNSNLWYGRRHIKYTTKEIDEQYPLLEFDTQSIELINELVRHTDAKIVISSSWRHNHTLSSLTDLFSKLCLKAKIIDFTPDFGYNSLFRVPRGCEIQSWLEDTKELIESYVILDDDKDMLYSQKDNFICIDNYFGITYNNIYNAIKILRNDT